MTREVPVRYGMDWAAMKAAAAAAAATDAGAGEPELAGLSDGIQAEGLAVMTRLREQAARYDAYDASSHGQGSSGDDGGADGGGVGSDSGTGAEKRGGLIRSGTRLGLSIMDPDTKKLTPEARNSSSGSLMSIVHGAGYDTRCEARPTEPEFTTSARFLAATATPQVAEGKGRAGADNGDVGAVSDDAHDFRPEYTRATTPVAIAAVATAVFRKAPNGAAYVERLRREAGVPVSRISQAQEAEIGFLTASSLTPITMPNEDVVSWDSGDGSFQICAMRRARGQGAADEAGGSGGGGGGSGDGDGSDAGGGSLEGIVEGDQEDSSDDGDSALRCLMGDFGNVGALEMLQGLQREKRRKAWQDEGGAEGDGEEEDGDIGIGVAVGPEEIERGDDVTPNPVPPADIEALLQRIKAEIELGHSARGGRGGCPPAFVRGKAVTAVGGVNSMFKLASDVVGDNIMTVEILRAAIPKVAYNPFSSLFFAHTFALPLASS